MIKESTSEVTSQRAAGWWKAAEEKSGTRLGAAAPNFLNEKSRRRRIPRPLYGQDIKTAELSRI